MASREPESWRAFRERTMSGIHFGGMVDGMPRFALAFETQPHRVVLYHAQRGLPYQEVRMSKDEAIELRQALVQTLPAPRD